jgi:parallel beta-helix repeat protein
MKNSKKLHLLGIILLLLLGLAGCKKDDPEIELNSDGNVGPRANTADDPAGGIYVAPNGNDATADGSIDKPYKSINTALAAAKPGTTVILCGGTYKEGVNVRPRKANITIKSRKGEWAVIDLTTCNSGHDEDSGVYFDPDASGCKLQSVEVKGGYYAVCMETTWDWGPTYPTRYGASNIIIEDCKLHDSKNDVVKVKPNCKNITIRYNEIYNSGREHVGKSGFDKGEENSEGIDNVNGDEMHVHNNYIHDICSNAIYAKGGATDVLIENNLIERAYGAGIMIGFDTSPEYFDIKANKEYYENIRGVVRNNLIINVGWEGIALYASKDAQVYNNTVVNAVGYGKGLYHSPIYFGVATQDWENPTGCPPNVNPTIHHNIVSQPSTYNNRMIDIRYATGVYSFGLSGLDGKPKMHDNCYFVAGKSATFTDNRPDNKLEKAGLAAWQSHTGADNGSLEVDPALDDDYMPANKQCAEMGIQVLLKVSK